MALGSYFGPKWLKIHIISSKMRRNNTQLSSDPWRIYSNYVNRTQKATHECWV